MPDKQDLKTVSSQQAKFSLDWEITKLRLQLEIQFHHNQYS